MSKINEFIKELRSGKYKQSRGQLSKIKDGERCYCALGVLQVMYNDAHSLPWNDEDSELSTPISNVSKWSGIDFEKDTLQYGGYCNEKIYELNDDHELSFEEIADIIESQYV